MIDIGDLLLQLVGIVAGIMTGYFACWRRERAKERERRIKEFEYTDAPDFREAFLKGNDDQVD